MDFKVVIQKIKNEYDIVDYIKANGVALEQSNNGAWKGLCPFHNEKTPSFVVNEGFQHYTCFGCGESGDIISFAQKTHTVTFTEALKMLAEEKGIEFESFKTEEPLHDINGIRKVVADADLFYKDNYKKLDVSHPAKQEVLKRNLDVDNEIYGYSLEAPNALYKFLKSRGHTDKNIEDSKLVLFYDNREPWDFFHGRLMITLSDYLGRPVSFTSRKIFQDDKMEGKYVNGKESPVFLKKSNLFGADTAKQEARKQKVIHIVEGQFDKIAIEEHWTKNVVATSGTAFTEDHTNLLIRMVGQSGKIVFILDGDEAGVKAALKIFASYKAIHPYAYAVRLADGMDPCDYIVNGKLDALRTAALDAKPLHNFVIEAIITKLGGSINMNNRQAFVSEVSSYAKCTDESYIIEDMLNKTSILSAISIDNVKEIYNKSKSINTQPSKSNKPVEIKEKPENANNLKISINMSHEADRCMITALSLLIRMPDKLVEKMPDLIHSKFRPFIQELTKKYEAFNSENKKWRFIAEDYEDVEFAKGLQRKHFLLDPLEDVESSCSQFVYLFDRANQIYKKDYEEMNKAKALSSIADTTDPKEIAKALNIYKESVSKLI